MILSVKALTKAKARKKKRCQKYVYYDKRGGLRKERVELAERFWSEDKDIENE